MECKQIGKIRSRTGLQIMQRHINMSAAVTWYLMQTIAANYARNFADYNVSPNLPLAPNIIHLIQEPTGSARFEPGSAQFKNAFQSVISNPDLTQGAKFIDHSKLYHSDVNYNFRDMIKFAEIQVGGSWRKYIMDSQGTIFTDYDGPIEL